MDVLVKTPEAAQEVALDAILLATDGSADAHVALCVAADLAKRSGAALHMVTAYQAPPSAINAFPGDVMPQDFLDTLEREAIELLAAERAELELLGASVQGMHARRGPVFDVISGVATSVAADLIVMGSRELTGLKRLLVGSVSGNVLHTAHRPVLIVRGGKHTWPPAQVIVGFDHSPEARRAARVAATIAHLYRGASLTLVEAVPHTPTEDAPHLTYGDLIELEHGHLDRHAGRLSHVVGRPVGAAMVVGDPAEVLLARSDDGQAPNLVVVGTRGLGGVKRFLLGSVSTRILHSGHTPLLVVPMNAMATQSDAEVDEG